MEVKPSRPLKKMKPRENIPLKDYTTFRIGGPARYFWEAKTREELIESIEWARKKNAPFFILGGGSNLLISDQGYNGLIIRMGGDEIEGEIKADAGVPLKKLVEFSVEKSLTGLEWAAGIPGTLGGAVWGNASAFGGKMSDLVGEMEVLKKDSLEIKKTSRLNSGLIILSVFLSLKKGKKEEIKKEIESHLNYRRQTQPVNSFSAGCVFKNSPGNPPSSLLIDQAGLKGVRIGGAEVSRKHANFIINRGEAKASDVKELIKLVKEKVYNKYNVKLEEEIKYL